MTGPPEGADLRSFYERARDTPTATGDHISGRQVIGFHTDPDGDHILLKGDENLKAPSRRPLPCDADPAGLERTGPSPVACLPADRLQHAPAGLRAAFEDAFATREDGQFVRGLLDEIVARKHHAWLVGGAVRDLLSAGPARPINDFDATGTIGPGCLEKLRMRRLRRRAGLADYGTWLSPDNVWSVTPPGQLRQRLVEYKPLARRGLSFPAWGGSLEEDAATRDLTVNALYYDRRFGVLADPCGDGRAHLDTNVMATPYLDTDDLGMACIIVRCLKFWLRNGDIDISRMVAWVRDELPDDFAARITEPGWKKLVVMRRRAVLPELDGRDEMTAAGEFGPKAMRLMQEIRARA